MCIRDSGASPRVIINGGDRSAFIRKTTTLSIVLNGSRTDLGLVSGPNTIYVIGAGGIATNSMVMTLG